MTIATATKKTGSTRKYITLDDGTDFRKIAEAMTKAGFKMNHATARNQLMLAMEKLFSDIGKQLNVKLNKTQISGMLHSQEVHNALADILYMAVNDSPKESKDSE